MECPRLRTRPRRALRSGVGVAQKPDIPVIVKRRDAAVCAFLSLVHAGDQNSPDCAELSVPDLRLGLLFIKMSPKDAI
ncbi:hypothetical protein TREES_T100003978 [Tupaia chinensis]|uniref:Uncharacterized protein n=1 Tax=Tupaia chinensis TaxID=246437 RepID=L9KXL7_TUPCH|nr:hypothetical protein TREES_T100003978 [Tupaia chinensis]